MTTNHHIHPLQVSNRIINPWSDSLVHVISYHGSTALQEQFYEKGSEHRWWVNNIFCCEQTELLGSFSKGHTLWEPFNYSNIWWCCRSKNKFRNKVHKKLVQTRSKFFKVFTLCFSTRKFNISTLLKTLCKLEVCVEKKLAAKLSLENLVEIEKLRKYC